MYSKDASIVEDSLEYTLEYTLELAYASSHLAQLVCGSTCGNAKISKFYKITSVVVKADLQQRGGH